MKHYSFFHKDTGELHYSVFSTDDPTQVTGNTPKDHVPIEGHHDFRLSRVDPVSRTVIPVQDEPLYQRRHRERMRRHVLWQIEVIEKKQPRAVREFLLGQGNAGMLQEIETQIGVLRQQLNELKENDNGLPSTSYPDAP